MAVDFEFAAKAPHMNSRVETKLYSMSCLTRSAMEEANIPDHQHIHCVHTVLQIMVLSKTDMLTVAKIDG